MSKAALQTVRDAIKTGSFKPVYFVFGEDDYQKEDAARQLQMAALDPATRDFNLEIARGGELKGSLLATLLSTPPIMAPRRVVIVTEVNTLRKDARNALDAYLERPADDILLVLIAAAGVKPDKKLLEKTTPLQFDELTGDRLPKWIMHTAKSAFGVDITPGGTQLLQASVGSDLYQLSTELDKLASFTQGEEIDEAAVSAVVGVTPGETSADFLDRIAERDVSQSLKLIPLILAQPKTSGVLLVMQLTTQFLAIGWGRSRLDEGTGRNRLAQEYFDLLKSSGAFAGRSWGSAASAWTKATGRWESSEVDLVLDVLLEADAALKESRISSEEQILANAVLAMCQVGNALTEGAQA